MNKSELIWELTKTDFKLKYAGSMLGFVWSLLKPLSMMGTLYVVFTFFFHNNIDFYVLFLLLGIILWNYFVDSINDSKGSVMRNSALLTKANLKPYLIILSACLHSFISFILNLIAFFIIFLIVGKNLTISALFFIPLALILFLITAALAHIVIILSSRFTDFSHIWDIFIQIGFWATPIIYTVEMVPQKWQFLIMINPLAQIISYSRDVLLYNTLPSFKQMLLLIIITLVIIIIAKIFYEKNKFLVVDRL
jgi:ABC-type polysaccharide/polyol phosphate export permease